MEITLGLAFIAGLASFLSPCVVSMVPVYISYITGRSVSGNLPNNKVSAGHSLLHGVAFVFGFSIIFISLGLAFSALGNLLNETRNWLEKIGGIIIILFGLQLTGLLKIPFLEHDLRPKTRLDTTRGFLSSFLLGVFFSAGWSPCVGPILGSILIIAMNRGDAIKGVELLTGYSIGMAIPFLIASLFIGWFSKILQNHRKALRIIEICMGIGMIVAGVMLFLGVFETLANFGSFFN